jgi:hypothetical protein
MRKSPVLRFALALLVAVLSVASYGPSATGVVSAASPAPAITAVDVFPQVCPHDGCTLDVNVTATDATAVTFGSIALIAGPSGTWTGQFDSQTNDTGDDMVGHYTIDASGAGGVVSQDSPQIRVLAEGNEGHLRFNGLIRTPGNTSLTVASGVDRRGWPILATGDTDTGSVYVYTQPSVYGQFADQPEAYSTKGSSPAAKLVYVGIADVTADGCPDLIAVDRYTSTWIWRGCLGGTTVFTADALRVPIGDDGATVADFTGDGKADIIGFGAGTLTVHPGLGGGMFAPAVTSNSIGHETQFRSVAVAGRLAVARDAYSGTVYVYHWPELSPVAYTACSGDWVAVGDATGDGIPDIVAPCLDQTLRLYVQKRTGLFVPQTVTGTGELTSAAILTLGDHPAVVAADTAGQQLEVFAWDGDCLKPTATLPADENFGRLTVGDANGDGLPDVVGGLDGEMIGDSGAPILVWLAMPTEPPVRPTLPEFIGIPALAPAMAFPDELWVKPGEVKTFPVQVVNLGAGPLSWTATAGENLSLSETSGTLGPGTRADLTLTVNGSQLAVGDYNRTVTVAGSGFAFSYGVAIDVNPAKRWDITVDPAATEITVVTGQSAQTTVALANPARNDQSWSSKTDAAGMSANPSSTFWLYAGQTLPVTITVNAAGLTPGEYTAHWIVTGTPNLTRVLTVSVHVVEAGAGVLAVAPEQLSAKVDEGLTTKATVTVANIGMSKIDWTAKTNAAWIHLSSDAGTLAKDERNTIQVTLDGTGTGIHTGTVTLSTTDGQTQTVTITSTVTGRFFLPLIKFNS